MSVNKISGLQTVSFGQVNPQASVDIPASVDYSFPVDILDIKKEQKPTNQAPEIGFLRTFFNRLSDEQIKQVNLSGNLPSGAKFIRTEKGKYKIKPNYLGITTGTRKLPSGYELKKNLLGFTIVVPEETSGLFIKDAI